MSVFKGPAGAGSAATTVPVFLRAELRLSPAPVWTQCHCQGSCPWGSAALRIPGALGILISEAERAAWSEPRAPEPEEGGPWPRNRPALVKQRLASPPS